MSDEILAEGIEPDEDEAFIEYDITTYPSDYTIATLKQLYDRGTIIVPKFQRKYVWSMKQASLLIESFLMGLPVPPIFLYVNDEKTYEVIDGQQRLLSLMYYLKGFFGPEDDKGRRQIFKLTGLSEKSPFLNLQFSELSQKIKDTLETSVLRAINIRQLSPVRGNTSVFHIFSRLNTGGTALRPQEIRNVVFRGAIVEALETLNKLPSWQAMLGLRSVDKYQRDVELILRLFALFEEWGSYEKPMKEFLNKKMKLNTGFQSAKAKRFQILFPRVLELIVEGLGSKPFRPKRVVNAAVLEAVFVALLEAPDLSAENLRERYPELMKSGKFETSIRGATTDTKQLQDRIETAKAILTP